MPINNAMVFAAGLGTRLAPITNDRPKAMATVCGKPLIWHVLKKLEEHNIQNVVVNTHHHSEILEDWLRNSSFDLKIQISHEEVLLDTAGGLSKASEYFPNGDILLYNVDVLSDININDFFEFHKKSNALATLAIRNRKSSRYFLFDQNNHLIGWKNIKTNETILNQNAIPHFEFAFSGIQIVKNEFLDFLQLEKKSLTPLYVDLSKNHLIQGYIHNQDYWFDCGTIENLKSAEQYLQTQ